MAKYKEQIQGKLKQYQDLGYKTGGKGFPPTHATAMDEHETRLQAEAKRYALDEHNNYKQLEISKSKNLSEIEQSLNEIETNCQSLQYESDLHENIKNALAQEKLRLIKFKKEKLEREADLKAFRALNGITQQADYPAEKIKIAAFFLVVIVGETVLNAAFYENANGLLGGALVALGVSVVNLLISAGLGYVFCYKNLKSTAYKLLGWWCAVLAIFLAIYLNAIFSAFRAEYQLVADPSNIAETTQAFQNASSAALKVFALELPAKDFLGFILFFVGLVLSAIAFYKGYSVDDKYPGHGRLDRLYKKADSEFEGLSLIVKEKLRTEIEGRRDHVASLRLNLQQVNTQLGKVRSAIASAHTDMRTTLKRIQNEYSLVLKTYRDSNISVRPTEPPEYFSEIPDIIESYMDDEGDALDDQISSIENRFESLRDNYSQTLSDKLSELAAEGKDQLGSVYTEYLEEIENSAKQMISKEKMVLPSQTGFGYEKQ